MGIYPENNGEDIYPYPIDEAIAEAVATERERCAAILDEAARNLYGGKKRINQIDAHTASVLENYAARIRNSA